jgi:hypothetical protein
VDVLLAGANAPKSNALCPVNSQLGVGHERGARPVDSMDRDRVPGLALIAGAGVGAAGCG